MIWEPFDPATWLSHVALGSIALLSGVAAMSVRKGSDKHKLAGRVFAIGAFIAAISAIAFSFTALSPPAIMTALMTIAAVTSAVLAFRQPPGRIVFQALSSFIFLAAFLFAALSALMLGLQGNPVALAPGTYSLFPLVMVISDIRFWRASPERRDETRVPRHVNRMTFAFALGVHAPVVSFADDWGLNQNVAFFGPLLLWPILYFLFRRTAAAMTQKETVEV